MKNRAMKNIFVINGAHSFAHSGGRFNKTLFEKTLSYFQNAGYAVKSTEVIAALDDVEAEVEKFVWADIVVYHTPIWWFHIPFGFKRYLDEVLTAGHEKGLYLHDGRSRKNPAINYGTGGLLHDTQYILTTSWNAPQEAFELEGEFFEQKSVDEGVMFGFHKMNQFMGMKLLGSFHFHDMEKNADVPLELKKYQDFLDSKFEAKA